MSTTMIQTAPTRTASSVAAPTSSHFGTMSNQNFAAFQINRVAQMLDVSRSTVYRLIRDKQLTLVKVGKRGSRITAESVSELLRAREAT
ncbi:helix-turn-helix domain-containing protein [Variovorax sp. J22G73]|uniref:helix-turn-helix domain-containing protein n=1 Tax=unclassified Variovorax TaxID=663243 RepID=UPI00257589FE|nr:MULTISPECIES: helix-turn-helix domain-containing protein [unclassified Variovorax]MDM0003935.1 helix-turn-helix domain-containing protein [Variovorax sp. J22R203]MDM0096399.1 helix-turn-helix domain-containing protein [Variovorax sp. J22G73]